MNLDLAFVDSITASPAVRLNLHNDQPWRTLVGTRFDPPPLRYATASTLLTDGERIQASAYANRVVTLRLRIEGNPTEDQAATYMQALLRELNRPTNFLRYQPGTSLPVFFRTFRCAPDSVDFDPETKEVTANVPAEPFAYGLKETLGGPLNANPYFETDVSNWTPSGGTFVRSTAQFHQGAASGLLTPDGVTAQVVTRAELVSATAGSGYIGSAWVRCAAARNVSVTIDWHNGGGLFSGSGTTGAVAANTWTLITVTATAPATTTHARLTVSMDSTPPAGHTLHVDEAVLASSFVVNNDPVATANGMFFDVTGVKGDVETPLVLAFDQADVGVSGRRIAAIGVRRRGTPSAAPLTLQVESMTPSTDTSAPGNDAAMSGAGSNYLRCTFATNQALATRATLSPFPAAASVDVRGSYRVFLRCRKSVAGDSIQVRLEYGVTSNVWVVGETKTVPQASTGLQFVELDRVTFPLGTDPVYDGVSGVERTVAGMYFQLKAGRTSGSGNLDIDYMLFVPADDRFALVKWNEWAGSTSQVLDSITESAYLLGSSGDVRSDQAIEVAGGFPMISPGVTNRVVYCNNAATPSTADVKTDAIDVTPSYFPRYVSVRPAST